MPAARDVALSVISYLFYHERHIKNSTNGGADLDLLLVAVDATDRPIGFIQAHRVCIIEVGFRVEILGLVVSSSARRGGIGRRLIAEAERWAKSIGAAAISVRSNTKRTEAHLFYPALGYTKIKTQAVYEKQRARSRERGAR